MMEHYDGDMLYSEILITKNVSTRIIMLVEGDSDCTILDPHIDETSCETLAGHSKSAVLEAIDLVALTGVADIIALVDRDWYGFGDEKPANKLLFITEHYDLDATVILAEGLVHRMALAMSDKECVRQLTTRLRVSDVREALVVLSLPLGVLRFESRRNDYQLKLRNLPMGNFLSHDTPAIDLDRLLSIAIQRSPRGKCPSPDSIKTLMSATIRAIVDAEMYCSGHDMAAILGCIIRKSWNRSISNGTLECALRGAFRTEDLAMCSFYDEISAWAFAEGKTVWRQAA